jgi:perosamine synthetase
VLTDAPDRLVLRAATMADAELLLGWANDPGVRRASFNSEPIDAATHVAWLEQQLSGGDTAFYICELEDEPLGYARLDRGDDGTAEIAVSIAATVRGRGYGTRLIELAAAAGRQALGVEQIVARIKDDNTPSLRAFRSAGFADTGTGDDAGGSLLAWQPPVAHSRPWITEEDAQLAAAVIRSGHLAQGAVVARLERRWCEETGAAAAACVASGVSALRLGLLALGVGPGDEVIVPAYSCVALLNAPLALGATPVLADVYLDDWTLSVEDARRRVTSRSRAIVAVNLFGMPSRLAELQELGLPVIEDCAHGIGGHTNAGSFGGGSEVCITSFYATKMIGAGEGGVVAVRHAALAERVRETRDYGDQLPSGLRLNDKMTDVEAVVALAQLDRLPDLLARRAERAAAYARALEPLVSADVVVLPADAPGRVWYRYAVRLLRDDAVEVCGRSAGLGAHLERPVWDLSESEFWGDSLESATVAFRRVVSLPLYPDLSQGEQQRVCAALEEALR